jgi:NAD(P)-dependent dehydrogenase (short-subunit alcohol dehydrogenase family)
MRMNGKTALVTGAATGIGLAIAQAFSREGARVVLADVDTARVSEHAAAISSSGGAMAVQMDVSSPASVAKARNDIESAGFVIDVLVNNAGVIHVGTILQTELGDLRRVFQVNVEGVFIVTKEFLPGMIERRHGTILNMASLASLTAMHDRFVYSASKAAVMMMTRSIALDFVSQGIRANCICPARVHTEMVDGYLKTAYADREAETFRKFSEYQPVGRMIAPAEIAHLAVYLCSDESQMVTGSSYLIDGGVMMGV